MANKDKETTGVWMEIDVGLKSLMDFVTQLSGKSRKDYVTELIEDDVYHRLNAVPSIENLLETLETRFPDTPVLPSDAPSWFQFPFKSHEVFANYYFSFIHPCRFWTQISLDRKRRFFKHTGIF